MKRFLVAYWCLYHVGAACFLSEQQGPAFWASLERAARNDELSPVGGRWPRGHERRDWRGKQAVDSAADLVTQYERPEAMVDWIAEGGHSFTEVATRVKHHRGFGPWISFKVCDMLDRCLAHHVDFTEAAVFMFKDPREAALRLWSERMAPGPGIVVKPKDPESAIREVVSYLKTVFDRELAPPLSDRAIGLQEIETILCKWKSHHNGHYPLFNDITEINEGLQQWRVVSTAASQFFDAMPKVPA